MRRGAIIAAAVFALVGGSAAAQTSTTKAAQTKSASKVDAKSEMFVRDAANVGMAEVELGRLATEKASSDDVKQFGQRMVTDHTKANDELKTLAESKGITLPADLDAQHKAARDKLSKLSGTAFDRAYMDEMRNGHKKVVAEFERESKTGTDPDLKAWAAKTLPTIESHLQMAERTAVGTSGTKSSGSPGATGAQQPSSGGTTQKPRY